MNRAIDSRTDLYSLGVTFYQMLTGRLPFEARDPLEWVHCHVARAPPSPAQVVPDVPEAVARIVLKLLAKMPEDRYQSARGLRLDLERCLAQWRARARVEPFALGERDVSDRLQIPQKLYGRERQVAALLGAPSSAWSPRARRSSCSSPATPASARPRSSTSCYKPIVAASGLLPLGQVRSVQARHPLRHVRPGLPGARARDPRRERGARSRPGGSGSRAALGINAPAHRRRDPARSSSSSAASRRSPSCRRARRRTGSASCSGASSGCSPDEEHPLALFLDDLQWADSASLGLLEDLLTHPETRHLLVIGAYRDNEVVPSHPLMLTLWTRRGAGARVSDIVLGPIPRGAPRPRSSPTRCTAAARTPRRSRTWSTRRRPATPSSRSSSSSRSTKSA